MYYQGYISLPNNSNSCIWRWHTHFAQSLAIHVYDDTCQFIIGSQISQQSDNGYTHMWCFVYQDYLVAQLLKRSWVEKLNEFIGPSYILCCMMSCPSDCDPPRTSMCSSMMLSWSLSPVETLRSQPQDYPVPLRDWKRRTEKLGGQDLRHSSMYATLMSS